MRKKSFSYQTFLKLKKLETLSMSMKIGYMKEGKENQQSLDEMPPELQKLTIWNLKSKKSST